MLEYAPDDILLSRLEQKLAVMPKFLFRIFKKRFRRKYGERNDLLRFRIEKLFNIKIGKYSYGFEKNCSSHSRIKEIGAFTSIAENLGVSLGNHSIDRISSHPFFFLKKFGFVSRNTDVKIPNNGDITIGHDVWIGRDVTILSGVTIGTGSVVGACALVTKNVPPYAVVTGVPARVARYRFDEETIKTLLDTKWWLWQDEKIRENINKFMNFSEFTKGISPHGSSDKK